MTGPVQHKRGASITSAHKGVGGRGQKVGKGLHFKMVSKVHRQNYRAVLAP